MPSARSKSDMATEAPQAEVLRWTQAAPRFAPLREGGPGRWPALLLLGIGLAALARWGQARIAAEGIDGAGPAAVLLAVLGLLTLALWLLVKAVLRPLQAEAVVDARGVRLVVPRAQRGLDNTMRVLTHIAFLLSWKGGQWASFAPELRWSELREIRHIPERGEYLLRGGAWDIRLRCPPELREPLRARIQTALATGGAKPGLWRS